MEFGQPFWLLSVFPNSGTCVDHHLQATMAGGLSNPPDPLPPLGPQPLAGFIKTPEPNTVAMDVDSGLPILAHLQDKKKRLSKSRANLLAQTPQRQTALEEYISAWRQHKRRKQNNTVSSVPSASDGVNPAPHRIHKMALTILCWATPLPRLSLVRTRRGCSILRRH